jgi:Zn-dependent protease with chaperone function
MLATNATATTVATINADYYDGKSSRRRQVTLVVTDDRVTVRGDGVEFVVPTTEVRIAPRLGGMPRRIEFPDGAAALTQDHHAVDVAFTHAAHNTLTHRLESHRGFVVVALILTISLCWSGYRYGVPWVAREVAMVLPASLEADLAEESLEALDGFVFRPSKLDASHRTALAKTFGELRAASGQPDSVRLEFRDGNWIGANALALPGGIVVMTDQLVQVVADDKQVFAVLAHELGHIQHRHSLRYVLQDSITALLAMAIYGDASAVTGIAATVPTALVHAQYSQNFEREADDYAFVLLKNTGRSPRDLGLALQALENADGKEDAENKRQEGATRKKQRSRDFGYLSTHPATQDRIQAAEAAVR